MAGCLSLAPGSGRSGRGPGLIEPYPSPRLDPRLPGGRPQRQCRPAAGRHHEAPGLVDSAGEPPRERWRLFSDYYRVIYDRERQRDIPAARLLGDDQADIDAIHQRVALRLQVDAERTSGTDAGLDATAFALLVDQRLAEEDHPDAERAELTRAITEAALLRLVFLVAPRDGAIGFEVRSLQEFMAAQCLTNGPDETVGRRLRAIAPAAHWRNCFLFAAGRCFHERQHLRDTPSTGTRSAVAWRTVRPRVGSGPGGSC